MTIVAAAPLPFSAMWLALLGGLAWIVATNLKADRPAWKLAHREHLFGLAGISMLVWGHEQGLFMAPKELMMGDVGRILYVHVPAAWSGLVVLTFCGGFGVAYLMTGNKTFDQLVEATAEVGILLAFLLQTTGMLWAKPTWGTFWDWDPRLITAALMMLSFCAVLILRSVLDDADQRATWTSVAAILATTSVFITYGSVRWWRSIHQMQSTPDTINETMTFLIRFNAVGMLLLSAWMVTRRWRIGAARAAAEAPPPLPAEVGV